MRKCYKLVSLFLAIAISLCNLSVAFAYNRTAAINYADTYATSYNPDYKTFGADCTNYTSQCLKNGGYSYVKTWAPRTDLSAWWYNNNGTIRNTSDDTNSYTWTRAADQYSFVVLNSSPHWGYVASSYLAPSNPYPDGVSSNNV